MTTSRAPRPAAPKCPGAAGRKRRAAPVPARVVTEVDPKSAAAERGFKEGDVILEVAGKSVANAGDVREAISSARTDNKNSVLMRVRSGGSSRFVAVPIGRG